MAAHPIVGTWVVDPDIASEAETPGLGIWTGDGIVTDPDGIAGSWEAVDGRTAVVTFADVFPDGSGYIVVRGPHVVDAAGETWTSDYSYDVVAPDGTVLDSGTGTARGTRLLVEPMEKAGEPLAAMHAWEPAAATPAP